MVGVGCVSVNFFFVYFFLGYFFCGDVFMVESYKLKSRLANVVVFVAGLVSYVGVNGLNTIVPSEYAYLVPVVVMIAGYIVVQGTEDKRVAVAEELVHEEYQTMPCVEDEMDHLNDEYTSTLGDE